MSQDRDSDSHEDSLSPDRRSQIENEFDRVFDQSRIATRAVVRYLKISFVALCVLAPVAYAADYIMLRRRPDPVATVEITRYYAVRLKNGKTDISHADSETGMCVNSFFPHLGYWPCWYVRRHLSKEIQIGSLRTGLNIGRDLAEAGYESGTESSQSARTGLRSNERTGIVERK